MDDSPIQTALCVIGHPIGGNPTQFVALRALSALGLDWQFMSFDVDPTQIQSAIGGIDSLGFCGAMIATPYQTQVAQWLSSSRVEASNPADTVADADPATDAAENEKTVDWYDCLHRNGDHQLVGSNTLAEALQSVIRSHTETAGEVPQCCLLIGDAARIASDALPFLVVLPERRLAIDGAKLVPWPPASPDPAGEADPEDGFPTQPSPASDEIETSPVLVIWSVDTKPSKKNASKVPPHSPDPICIADLLASLHRGSLLIDLSGTSHAWLMSAAEAGDGSIAVVDKTELEIMRLAIAIQHWTARPPNIDLMREAIEEYLEI